MAEDQAAELLSTAQAAELAGLTRRALYTLAGRARAAGVEVHAPRETWPDARTPRWDGAALRAYLAARPGRGANLRRTDPGCAPGHFDGDGCTFPTPGHLQ